MMLEYAYPDGMGADGTFTDGDQFSQETVQAIIDNVVATTKADTERRITKQLEETKATFLGTAQDYVAPGIDLAIAIIKGENK